MARDRLDDVRSDVIDERERLAADVAVVRRRVAGDRASLQRVFRNVPK